ncbi:carbamoyltransferase [Algoriphagus sp. 4150]|uniref:carbamoyltransferase family protein n=1 Tax=Algoriphagus sp. 4150 TaxID=2817756 RepID=UPI00285E590C|nr:carbamoyltransferase N-terminal domain-containing protein [Algoriphagus sp. 4150]MDR7128025.1 carbamoyltransferase [Algoriphagus sp. 4150]
MLILGISCYYHDSAACLLSNGTIVAAAQEERFTRIKNDSNFPYHAIIYCLKEGEILLQELDAIVYYEKPYLKLERILERFLVSSPFGFRSFAYAMPKWVREKLFFKRKLRKDFKRISNERLKVNLFFSEHHLSHAAQAFFLSPFENATVLTIDAVGEWETLTVYKAKGNNLTKTVSMLYPESLGLFYSAFTYFLGFQVNDGEYKLMGLAAYGAPDSSQFRIYYDKITQILLTNYKGGSFRLNSEYFRFEHDLKLINEKKWEDLFNLTKRLPESQMAQVHADLALAAQQVLENTLIKIVELSKSVGKSDHLCFAGGVSLNGAALGKISKLGVHQNCFVPFAPGDSGAAIGAALAYYHCGLGFPRVPSTSPTNPFLGPSFSDNEVQDILVQEKLPFIKLSNGDLYLRIANEIASGKIVGWFQGKAEFGPRALGNRSILADSRSLEIQDRINSQVKFREEFRPFAPAILEEEVSNFFDSQALSPYMQYVWELKKEFRIPYSPDQLPTLKEKQKFAKSSFPAVTHVDYTARVQTVSSAFNARFYNLLLRFHGLTGCPMVLNTSFNKRGEPIVNSPKEAIVCFKTSEIDILVINNFIILK